MVGMPVRSASRKLSDGKQNGPVKRLNVKTINARHLVAYAHTAPAKRDRLLFP